MSDIGSSDSVAAAQSAAASTTEIKRARRALFSADTNRADIEPPPLS